ncbi:YjjG family noncanonical pyrimidine nucleotidase [Agrilactobacillus fermenti]|uniref:YjjG family noncanonical pyrimidine nucleotidase n=1 Tax=Agrilactobacillus fermenti TaxID=2586909 RepID=UPI003A5C6768
MSYKFLLFDLDNTIFDFDAAEAAALSRLFEQLNIPLTQDIRRKYHQFNQKLWQMYEKDEISRSELLEAWFPLFFQKLRVPLHGLNPGKIYRGYLQEGHQLLPDAKFILQQLAKSFRLFAVTNGISATQRQRLDDAGIISYFDDLFISEEIGHQKPAKSFFDYVFAHIPNFELAEAVVIGDSLSSDILGGTNAHVDTIWYNPDFVPNHSSIHPIYQIAHLTDLPQLLSNQVV